MSEDEDDEEEEDESELELLPLRRDGWVWVSAALGFSTAGGNGQRTDKRDTTGELTGTEMGNRDATKNGF